MQAFSNLQKLHSDEPGHSQASVPPCNPASNEADSPVEVAQHSEHFHTDSK